MENKVSTIDYLKSELDRAFIRVDFELAVVWLFAGFCYCLSKKTGNDWFSRSGALMCLGGAAVTFELVKVYQNALARLLKEHIGSLREDIDRFLEPPKRYQRISYAAYLTGIVGTAIWGYGDLLL